MRPLGNGSGLRPRSCRGRRPVAALSGPLASLLDRFGRTFQRERPRGWPGAIPIQHDRQGLVLHDPLYLLSVTPEVDRPVAVLVTDQEPNRIIIPTPRRVSRARGQIWRASERQADPRRAAALAQIDNDSRLNVFVRKRKRSNGAGPSGRCCLADRLVICVHNVNDLPALRQARTWEDQCHKNRETHAGEVEHPASVPRSLAGRRREVAATARRAPSRRLELTKRP